jgi:hypothetical protein
MAFVIGLALSFTTATPAYAEILGNGSAITDTLQIGVIQKIGKGKLTIATKFEKNSKTYELVMLPDAYVMTANRGVFKKFKELKKGDLIAAYGWYKGGKWNARRIDILDPKDYLVKRLASDAKAKFYYKHERVN